jgi:cytochrome c5
MVTVRLHSRFRDFFVAACAVALSGCAGDSDVESMALDSTDQLLLAATRVALPPVGMQVADLPDPDSPGAANIATYCSACHAIPSPMMHSATDWPSVIRRMWLRTDRIEGHFGVAVPTPSERLVMVEYLINNALVVRTSGLPDGPGREAFVSTCSRCHELPDPSQHSSEDWVSVVRRMTGHMEDMLGEFLSQAEFQEIVLYLGVAFDPGE